MICGTYVVEKMFYASVTKKMLRIDVYISVIVLEIEIATLHECSRVEREELLLDILWSLSLGMFYGNKTDGCLNG